MKFEPITTYRLNLTEDERINVRLAADFLCDLKFKAIYDKYKTLKTETKTYSVSDITLAYELLQALYISDDEYIELEG